MDSPSTPPRHEVEPDAPSPFITPDTGKLTAPDDPDFIPPVVKKPSKFSYLWLVLIIGLVLSVVGVGAYILDSESKTPTSLISALHTPTPPVSRPPATPTPDPVTDWETYKDDAFGITFKYPKDWTLTEEKNELLLEKADRIPAGPSGREQDYIHKITIEKRGNSASLTLKEALESYFADNKVALDALKEREPSSIKIGGFNALRFSPPGIDAYFMDYTVVKFGNTIYTINSWGLSREEYGMAAAYSGILSTFTTTASTSATPSGTKR